MKTLIWIASIYFASPSLAQEIKVAHGAAADTIVHAVKKEMQAAKSPVTMKLAHESGMTGDSLLMILDRGEAELGIAPSSWDTMKQVAIDKKLNLKNLDKMRSRQIGTNRVVVIVSKGLPDKLSKEQIKKLFTGQVENWKDIGGPNLPVNYIVPANMRVTSSVISTQWLDGEAFRFRAPKEVASMEGVVDAVKSVKGGISFVSAATNLDGVTVLENPVLDRPVTAIYIGEPQPGFEAIFNSFSNVLSKKPSK